MPKLSQETDYLINTHKISVSWRCLEVLSGLQFLHFCTTARLRRTRDGDKVSNCEDGNERRMCLSPALLLLLLLMLPSVEKYLLSAAGVVLGVVGGRCGWCGIRWNGDM